MATYTQQGAPPPPYGAPPPAYGAPPPAYGGAPGAPPPPYGAPPPPYGAPGAPPGVVMGALPKTFESGLFDCCSDMKTCCMGFWPCGCYQYLAGESYERAGVDQKWPSCGILCCLTVLDALIAGLNGPLGQAGQGIQIFRCCIAVGQDCYMAKRRSSMREKFGLGGMYCDCCSCCRCCTGCAQCSTPEKFDDFCVHFWCRNCAVCQEARMLDRFQIRDGMMPGQGVVPPGAPPPMMPPMAK